MAGTLPHLLILGGSGRTGKLVIAEALSRGHTITAMVRRASSLTPQTNLNILTGNPCSTADVEATLSSISGPIVIISTLGQTRTSGNPFSAATSPPGFMAASAEAVVSAVKTSSANVQKYITMSMFGTGSSFSNLNFLMRWTMLHSTMNQTLGDQNMVDQVVKHSEVIFVLVRAAMLKGEQALPVNELGDEGEKAVFMPSISPQSVARFLLDAAVRVEWDGRTPVIAN